jgi:hypothetical protein
MRGPAPPAAVAAAAKIALAGLGKSPEKLFHRDSHERTICEVSPVDPARTSLMERSDSGLFVLPKFQKELMGDIDEWIDHATKRTVFEAERGRIQVRGPLEDPERRNRNLQWLRTRFRSLNEVGRLPFNNADLWQLHQYYFSPPSRSESDKPFAESDWDSNVSSLERKSELYSKHASPEHVNGSPERTDQARAPPPTPCVATLKSPCTNMGRAVSFQALGDAFVASGIMSRDDNMHKRRSDIIDSDEDGPATKRARSWNMPRIGFYPRVMAKIQSLGTKPMEQSLGLLRQLKYTENVLYAGVDPYSDEMDHPDESQPSHADVEMILLDLL